VWIEHKRARRQHEEGCTSNFIHGNKPDLKGEEEAGGESFSEALSRVQGQYTWEYT
jgi:hypothetical protein